MKIVINPAERVESKNPPVILGLNFPATWPGLVVSTISFGVRVIRKPISRFSVS
jgi:hypothetical protein